MVQLAREHRRLWRVELSVRHVVGHDAAGRRQALAWSAVDRIDVTDAGLLLVGDEEGGQRTQLLISVSMPDFSTLAHRAVEYAEAHRRTICVDGCPIELMDLVALFPAVCEPIGPAAARPTS